MAKQKRWYEVEMPGLLGALGINWTVGDKTLKELKKAEPKLRYRPKPDKSKK